MLLNTGPELAHSSHGLLTTVCFQLGPKAPVWYALEGSVAIAGAGVTWLQSNLGLIASPAEVQALAESVADTADVYFVPALGGLLAPHWRDDARGLIVGLSQYSTKAHLARAMLEAICFQTREARRALRVAGGFTAQGCVRPIQVAFPTPARVFSARRCWRPWRRTAAAAPADIRRCCASTAARRPTTC